MADYISGRAPPDPRASRAQPTARDGFLTDFAHFSADEIAHDPFYEGYLRPLGFGWHGCALLDGDLGSDRIDLSLKRRFRDGPYEPQHVALLNETLPTLRAAVALSRAVLTAESRDMGRALGRNGEAVFEIDARGRMLASNAAGDALIGSDIRLVSGRLVAALPADERLLGRVIATALGRPPQPGFAVLAMSDADCRLLVHTVPIPGLARDLFGVASALVVLTVWQRPPAAAPSLVAGLREAFGLTGSEARVAALVSLGLPPAEAARAPGLGTGTARNRLKTAAAKMGVSRQAELAALVASLRL